MWMSNLGWTAWREMYLQQFVLRGKPGRSMEAEGAQCSLSFPAGSLLCRPQYGEGVRGALCALLYLTLALLVIPLEERQAQLTPPGTKQALGWQLGMANTCLWAVRPWPRVQPRAPGAGGMSQPCRAAGTAPCPLPAERCWGSLAPLQRESRARCKCPSSGWSFFQWVLWGFYLLVLFF